jgi:hypothetical protein
MDEAKRSEIQVSAAGRRSRCVGNAGLGLRLRSIPATGLARLDAGRTAETLDALLILPRTVEVARRVIADSHL